MLFTSTTLAACTSGGDTPGDAGVDARAPMIDGAMPAMPDAAMPAMPDGAMPAMPVEGVVGRTRAECMSSSSIRPLADEIGQYAAIELVPPSYPFTLRRFEYDLVGAGTCTAMPAHRVFVFTTTDSVVSDPTVLFERTMPEAMADEAERTVALDVDPPLVIASPQRVWIAVQMNASADRMRTMCWRTCYDDIERQSDWWASSTEAPYRWSTLASFGLPDHYLGRMVGSYVPRVEMPPTCDVSRFPQPRALNYVGELSAPGDCPPASDPAWRHYHTFGDDGPPAFQVFCSYEWQDPSRDPDPCALPADGARPAYEWMEADDPVVGP